MAAQPGLCRIRSEILEDRISNDAAHIFIFAGLQGVDLGNYLIKKVVGKLCLVFPNMSVVLIHTSMKQIQLNN